MTVRNKRHLLFISGVFFTPFSKQNNGKGIRHKFDHVRLTETSEFGDFGRSEKQQSLLLMCICLLGENIQFPSIVNTEETRFLSLLNFYTEHIKFIKRFWGGFHALQYVTGYNGNRMDILLVPCHLTCNCFLSPPVIEDRTEGFWIS